MVGKQKKKNGTVITQTPRTSIDLRPLGMHNTYRIATIFLEGVLQDGLGQNACCPCLRVSRRFLRSRQDINILIE